MTAARTLAVAALAVAAVIPVAGGVLGGSSSRPARSRRQPARRAAAGSAKHGPMFPECGGISDQTMAEQTRVTGLVKTARQLGRLPVAGRRRHPRARTSPSPGTAAARSGANARPRNCPAPASRTSTSRATTASSRSDDDPTLGDNLCEIGIQFDDDFIEWSISFAEKPFPPACDVAKELTRQSIVNAK